MTNILKVVQCVVRNFPTNLSYGKQGGNRINAMGIPLEELIKDIFADTLGESNVNSQIDRHSQAFSYLGNQNNPPDLIIKNGDAIEIKKIESLKSGIHLNSSYPKSKLLADDPMILESCRSVDSGNWKSKDLIYVIGIVREHKLKRLWFIVGDCLAADHQIYKRIRDKMIAGIEEIPGVELAKTKELGRVNKVDPLGITYLRIRGMWGIANPSDVYNYLGINYHEASNLEVITILTEQKYNSIPQSDIDQIVRIQVRMGMREMEEDSIKA
jgi:hypothetical protein